MDIQELCSPPPPTYVLTGAFLHADFTRWCPESSKRWRVAAGVFFVTCPRSPRNLSEAVAQPPAHRNNVRKRSVALRFWTSVHRDRIYKAPRVPRRIMAS